MFSLPHHVLGVLAVGAIYFASARLGLSLAFETEQVSAVWPPTGVALAAMLLVGYRVWPGIALGAFLANAMANEPLLTAAGIGAGNTLEALVGAWLLNRVVQFQPALMRLRDSLALILLAAGLSTMISATIGTASLCLGGVHPWPNFGRLWRLWWLGDAVGALVVAPILLTWTATLFSHWSGRKWLESAALTLGTIVAGAVLFVVPYTPVTRYVLVYSVFPLVIWAALRLGPAMTATITFIMSGIAIWGTAWGLGPFARGTAHESLILLQSFMGMVATTSLLLASVISERSQAQQRISEQGKWLEAVLNLMPVPFLFVDPRTARVTFSNRSADELAGGEFPKGQPSENDHTVYFCTDAEGRRIPLDQMPSARVARGERLHNLELDWHVGQIKRPLLLWADTLPELHGNPPACMLMFQDVSRLKEVEEELRQAGRRKDEFLATLAHELRNPLAPISHAVELLGIMGHDPERREELRQVMQGQVRQMVRMIDDLLEVSRISRGKIELRKERFDLRVLAEKAVQSARAMFDESRLQLSVHLGESPLPVLADSARLVQVFSNLLNNACKFTPEGGRVSLTMAGSEDEVVVRVRDTGIGIPPDKLSEIFQMFSQLRPPLERGQIGLGIGLTLVQNLVEMHGGSVVAHSEGEGKGSEFIVRLPLAAEAESEKKMPHATFGSAHETGYRILVVEDSEPVAQMFAMLLRQLGHDVDVVLDGPTALRRMKDVRAQIVFSDISMPRMNGYELAKRLRQTSDGGRAVLVAMSGFGQEEDRQLALDAGFDYHLVKPATIDQLSALFMKIGARAS